MAYGTLAADVIQSSTANTPVQFNDGNGTQIGKLARAWVQFNGSTAVINGSFNVSSVTRNATADYTLNYTTNMPNINYSVCGNTSPQYGTANSSQLQLFSEAAGATEVAPTVSATRFSVKTLASNPFDPKYVCVSVFA